VETRTSLMVEMEDRQGLRSERAGCHAGRMSIVRKVRLGTVEARERSSATREIPPELRGRRVMTRLLALVVELREQGTEARTIHLSLADEVVLFESAGNTFGPPGEEAAGTSAAAWREFLVAWMRGRVDLAVVFDASETRVSG
jgi:hypothetical protein